VSTYKELVFTNHATDRRQLRKLTEHQIWEVINHPDKEFGQGTEKVKFIKTIKDRHIHVVAKPLNDPRQPNSEWLVISVWVRGEDDPVPLVWQLIVLPFKIIWWIIKSIFNVKIWKLKKITRRK
jgi:hypothetical protein